MKAITFITDKLKTADGNGVLNIARQTAAQLLSFVLGLLFASINTLSAFSPFGVAFAVSVDSRYLISSAFGAGTGYILSQDSLPSMRYICALLCCTVLIRLVRRFETLNKFRFLEACTAFLMLFLTGMTVLFASRVSMRSFFVILAEAFTGFVAAYFFTAAGDSLKAFGKQKRFGTRELEVTAICLFLLLLPLDEITVFSVSPARAVAGVCILILSALNNEVGVAASVGAGVVFLADRSVGTCSFAYSAAGLVIGIIGNTNRYYKALLFFAAYTGVVALISGSFDKTYLMIEAAAACAVYILIPETLIKKIRIISAAQPQIDSAQRQAVLTRLNSAAAAVSDISGFVSAASDMLRSEAFSDTVEFYSTVRDKVCRGCKHFNLCWGKNFGDCKRSFDMMSETLNGNGCLYADRLPQFLAGCCVKKQELVQCFVRNYTEFKISQKMQQKVEKIRLITGEQFSGMYTLLSEISEDFSKSIDYDSSACDKIYSLLSEQFGIKAKAVVCSLSETGHLRVEITLSEKPTSISSADFRNSLEEILSLELSQPLVTQADGVVTVIILEKTKYRVEAAASRICADRESLCGDSYEGFYDTRGNYFALLSDGMGTGFRAAVDSSLTSSMAARLLKAGFSCENAIRLVNSAMLLKSARESLSTLDILKINLYSGQADFYKAGACLSLIKHKSRVTQVDEPSMPLGILRDTDFARHTGQLQTGDMVLMGSDGAFEYSENAVKDAFSTSLNESAAEITQRTMLQAQRARRDCRSDDITLIALRLHENH